jgi:hypothetical protein
LRTPNNPANQAKRAARTAGKVDIDADARYIYSQSKVSWSMEVVDGDTSEGLRFSWPRFGLPLWW